MVNLAIVLYWFGGYASSVDLGVANCECNTAVTITVC